MARGRYYTPAARIEPVAGVTRKPASTVCDVFVGTAEALERSGVLRADMLPGPDSYSIAWRPYGVERHRTELGLESIQSMPGFVTISRLPVGGFRVYLAVSREEQAARKAAEKQEQQERQRVWDAAERARRPKNAPVIAPREGPRPVGFEVMRRLAAIESLCLYAQAAVRLKMGDSSKLARADEDLDAAISALVGIRGDIAAADPLGQDKLALAIAASGRMAAESYMRCAKSTPRTSAGDAEDD
jgi:hypothetical protein